MTDTTKPSEMIASGLAYDPQTRDWTPRATGQQE